MNLTEHFSWEEMTATSHADLQAQNRVEAESYRQALTATCKLGEEVRAILGVPMTVTSGFRGPSVNAAAKGSRTSQHMKGEAMDFLPGGGLSLQTAFDRILDAGKAGKIYWGQLLIERGWIHISLGSPWRDPARCGEYGHQRADGSVSIDGRV